MLVLRPVRRASLHKQACFGYALGERSPIHGSSCSAEAWQSWSVWGFVWVREDQPDRTFSQLTPDAAAVPEVGWDLIR
jgi:hypothetical protein